MGDGANDIPMLLAAGTGIAFRAKPQVQATVSMRSASGRPLIMRAAGIVVVQAPCCLNHERISLILPILGLEARLDFVETQG